MKHKKKIRTEVTITSGIVQGSIENTKLSSGQEIILTVQLRSEIISNNALYQKQKSARKLKQIKEKYGEYTY